MASEGIDVTVSLSMCVAEAGRLENFTGDSFEWKVHDVTRWAIPFLILYRSPYLVGVAKAVTGMPVLRRRVYASGMEGVYYIRAQPAAT